MKNLKFVFVLFALASITTSCNKDLKALPDPIQDLVDTYKSNGINCDQLHSYTFQEATVYVFSSNSCIADGLTLVYDVDGIELCMLDGFAGLSECNGEHFYPSATDPVLIWEE